MITSIPAIRVATVLTTLAVAAISGCATNYGSTRHAIGAERTIDICYSRSVHLECSAASADDFEDEMERHYEMEEIAQLEREDDW